MRRSDRKRKSNSKYDNPEEEAEETENTPKKRKTQKKELYCICRKPHESGFMIACDFCNQWFHGKCVGITAAQGKRLEHYKCPLCLSSDAAPQDFDPNKRQSEEFQEDSEVKDGAGDEEDMEEDEEGEQEEEEEGEEEGETAKQDSAENQASDEEIRLFIQKQIEQAGSCSVAILRRSFGIGYRRAKRLIDDEASVTQNKEDSEFENDDDKEEDEEEEQTSEGFNLRPRSRRDQQASPRGKVGASKRAENSEGETDSYVSEIRKKVIASLGEALAQEKRNESEETEEWKDPVAAATAIEEEMFNMFKRQTEKEYKAKYRSLLFNINANPDLRKSILSGLLAPDHLCRMTSQELAPQQLSEWRKARTEKYFAENVLITEDTTTPIVKKTHKGEEILRPDPLLEAEVIEPKPLGVDHMSPHSSVKQEKIEETFLTEGEGELDSSIANGVSTENSEAAPETPKPKVKEEIEKKETEDIKSVIKDLKKEKKEKEEAKEEEEEEEQFLIQEQMAMEPAIDIKIDTSLLSGFGIQPPFLEPKLPSLVSPPSNSHTSADTFHRPGSAGKAGMPGQVLWTGFLSKTNFEKCKVSAFHVNGPHTSSIQNLLPQTLHVEGRLEFPKLASYLMQLASSRSREHSICCFEPQGEEAEMAYIALMHYFSMRQRAGVVINLYGAVKEMYIIPLASDDQHFRDVIHIEKGDKLVGVVVTEKLKH